MSRIVLDSMAKKVLKQYATPKTLYKSNWGVKIYKPEPTR